MQTWPITFWIAASLAVCAEGHCASTTRKHYSFSITDKQIAVPNIRSFVKRSDGLSSSSTQPIKYAENGEESTEILQSSRNSTLPSLSVHSGQYSNSSLLSTNESSSSQATQSWSESEILAIPSLTTSSEYASEPLSLPPANASLLAPSSSSSALQSTSNSSSSHIVTAVYSRTHISVVHTGNTAAHSSAWPSTGAVHYPSANASLHSFAYFPPGGAQNTSKSQLPGSAAASASLSISSTKHDPPRNGSLSASHNRSSTAVSTATAHYPSNGTSVHLSGASQRIPILSTGYLFANGSSSAPQPGTTGFVGGYGNNTNATVTIPRTGSGYLYAQACNKASVDWSSSWLQDQIHPGTIVSPTPAYTPPPEGNVYALCDGVPRMRVNMTTVPTPYTGWTVTPPATLTGAPPEPNCTVVPSDCSRLLSSYVSPNAGSGNLKIAGINFL